MNDRRVTLVQEGAVFSRAHEEASLAIAQTLPACFKNLSRYPPPTPGCLVGQPELCSGSKCCRGQVIDVLCPLCRLASCKRVLPFAGRRFSQSPVMFRTISVSFADVAKLRACFIHPVVASLSLERHLKSNPSSVQTLAGSRSWHSVKVTTLTSMRGASLGSEATAAYITCPATATSNCTTGP